MHRNVPNRFRLLQTRSFQAQRSGNPNPKRNKLPLTREDEVVKQNNMAISKHMRNGQLESAHRIFNNMPHRTCDTWNSMISGYLQNDKFDLARRLFDNMPTRDLVSWNVMLSGYVRNRKLSLARLLFDEMPHKDVVSWNTMLSGYAQNGYVNEAREIFDEMPEKNNISWNGVLAAYIQNGRIESAYKLFESKSDWEIFSWNSMMAGFLRRKRLVDARCLFDRTAERDLVSWNTMISGYAQNGGLLEAHAGNSQEAAIIAGYAHAGNSQEALNLFIEMMRDGERMNRSTFTCALSTSADVAALELGQQVHGRLVKAGYELGCYVGNALLAMYCKCGSIEEAHDVFEAMAEKDVVSWNTMIVGYARHGFGKQALEVFESMELKGIKPDDVTMVGVLSACSHAGLVSKGTDYFHSMDKKYGIKAKANHYTCMIDLLGRAGLLEDAESLMRNMPFEPDAATWGALLGASRTHGNTKLGEEAARKCLEMEPENSGMYVLLSNLYASSGRWSDVQRMRVIMRDKGVNKVPGYSWMEVQNKIHIFSAGDSVHPEKDRIYAFLEELDLLVKKEGFVSVTKMVLHDVEEEEKEHMLRYHSEKLAVAFGILSIPPGRPIRVIKNLRVCEDCHKAIKLISKVTGRLIILRDSNRFHHFSNGSCSCGDYW
ncbi:hypothetical protein C5167_023078 [Papaver somniferum]|uniref:DYW domain-containing protein n=1 Tax=Papaver somniferum TaxID=3469 RepID=A0A4Y7JNE0_PAPSO|nr:pentatricopeptide repeat-containing protein At4g02750-like [Papaver somniferum]RZC61308.1 hypothetical protein C5167_023078 [Papaver somniferum]